MFEHLTSCPVCQARERTLLHADLEDTLFRNVGGRWNMYRCAGCTGAYLTPRPDAQHISRAYSHYFTHDTKTGARPASQPEEAVAKGWRARTRTSLSKGLQDYRNRRWNMAASADHPTMPWWIAALWPLRSLVAEQMRHLPERPPRPGACLLDIGCGNGAYLLLARAAGWEVQGVDFDLVAVAAARDSGLDVRLGGLEQLAQLGRRYDRITCSHVIEHVHDPAVWLNQMANLLEPGGTLWLQTPNVESLGHQVFGRFWLGLDPPRHLSLFTPDRLIRMLRERGLAAHVQRLPALSAVAVYEASAALRAGRFSSMALPLDQLVRSRYLALGTLQWLLRSRSEFTTVLARLEA